MPPDEAEAFYRQFPLAVQEPPGAEREPAQPVAGGLSEPPASAAGPGGTPSAGADAVVQPIQEPPGAQAALRAPTPPWFWWSLAGAVGLVGLFYLRLDPPMVHRIARASRVLTRRVFLAVGLPATVVLADVPVSLAAAAAAVAVGGWAALRGASGRRALVAGAAAAGQGTIVLCGLLLLAAVLSSVFAQFGGHVALARAVLGHDASGTLFLPLLLIGAIVLGALTRRAIAVAVAVPFVFPMLPRFDLDPLHVALLVALCMQIAVLLRPVPLLPWPRRPAAARPDRRVFGALAGRGALALLAAPTLVGVSLTLVPAFGLWLPPRLLP